VVALRGVSLNVAAGEVVGLMGRNGSGKSSLLWALQGSGRRDGGVVAVDGVDPATLDPADARRLVALVPQTPTDLLYLETVAEECRQADVDVRAAAGTTRALLDCLVGGVADSSHPRDLSEGQRLALVLAIQLAARPKAILLDEPTRGLDYAGKRALAATLGDLASTGHAVMVATHDVEFAASVATRIVVLAEGEVIADGPAAEVVLASPAFAPQVAKILAPSGWITVEQVMAALEPAS
jgi:energy-coupling factor transport system ATP-binding protein